MKKVQFEFEGKRFDVNPDCVNSYKTMKAIARVENDPKCMFDVLEAIFDGKDEEYAEAVGGSMDKMGELIAAAIEAVGAKNS